MKTGYEPGTVKYILPIFFSLGSLNILFLQSKQLFQIVAFPGVLMGELLGMTPIRPFYKEILFDFVVSLVFYFILGVIIDIVWGLKIKRQASKEGKTE